MVFIALSAVLCGAEDCTDMASFAQARQDWVKTILDLPHAPPSHDTFSRGFRLLEPSPFELAFTRFASGFTGKLKGVVAIDGKALRGVYKRGTKSSPLHMVSIGASEARMHEAQERAQRRFQQELDWRRGRHSLCANSRSCHGAHCAPAELVDGRRSASIFLK